MPKPTKKRVKSHKPKPQQNTTKKIKIADKFCYTDDEMGKICTTGQYSTYEGNFYKNKDNIKSIFYI